MSRQPDRALGGPVVLALVLLSAGYLVAVLPYLGDFPVLDWPQMGIIAPAHKLADEGVYGNDLFAGYHRSEERNYEYMPAYPLLVALSFELFGLGVWQARLVSVLCGWLTLLLIFQLGRQLYGTAAGLIAATLWVTLRPGRIPETSGIMGVDFARVVRYDVLVPVFVLAASCCFLWAMRQPADAGRASDRASTVRFFAAGLLAGLATLAHVYGAFILAVLAAVLLWHRGWGSWRAWPPYALLAGWGAALLPWVLYVLRDVPAYAGQMSRHHGRFGIFDLAFYRSNLEREIWRFAAWSGGSVEAAFLRPRAALWLLLVLVPVSSVVLWRRARRADGSLADRFLLLALPILELCLALLIALKRYYYAILVLPFMVLQLAFLADRWRRWAEHRGGRTALVGRVALAAVLGLVASEAGWGVARVHVTARQTTPYLQLTEAIASSIPTGSRLLISQPYWLGLKRRGHHELRSLNLVFLAPPSRPLAAVMRELAPDFVVLESYYLERDPTNPRASPGNAPVRRVFLALGAYLEERCSVTAGHDSESYGLVEVYDCRRAREAVSSAFHVAKPSFDPSRIDVTPTQSG